MSFAYNDWRQHIGPGAIVNPNNEIPGTNTTGPAVDSGINARWQFNVSGTVQLPWEIVAGVNFFGRDGFPIPYSFDAVTNDVQGAVPTIQIGTAGDYRYPAVFQLDLQISRAFRIGSSVTVSPELACFNALNQQPRAVSLVDRGGVCAGRQRGAGVLRQTTSSTPPLEGSPAESSAAGVRIAF